MSTWYRTYHISIWYTVGKFLGFSLGNEEKLNAICRDIAKMIENKYEAKDSSAISPIVAKELDIICRNTAMMIADKYKDKN